MEEHVNAEVKRKERMLWTMLVLALSITLNIVFAYTIHMNLESIHVYQNKVITTETRAVELEDDLERMTTENKQLNAKVEKLERKLAEQPKRRSLGVFKLTAYYAGEDEWGDTIAKPCDGQHKARLKHTIAVDPNVIPPNSKVLIDGTVYTAEDVGSAIKGNIIDIWVGTEENSFGVKYKEVRIMEK